MKQDIIGLVLKEMAMAKKKHPHWPDHIAARAGIVCEEAGELMRACLQKKYERKLFTDEEHKARMKEEAIHVAATALRFIENL